MFPNCFVSFSTLFVLENACKSVCHSKFLSTLESDDRVALVANHIISHHTGKTRIKGNKYTAIFATSLLKAWSACKTEILPSLEELLNLAVHLPKL